MKSMKTCRNCRKRSTCEAICAEIEAQLPAISTGCEPKALVRARADAAYLVQHHADAIESARERAMCVLHYSFGWSHREIADCMRVTRQAVSKAIAKGVRACAKGYENSSIGRNGASGVSSF